MHRQISSLLDDWLGSSGRKPLILRGARQVGKTWLIRDLARRSGRKLVEINFERDPSFRRYFESHDARHILAELSLALGTEIRADQSVLFLDEVQAAGEVLAGLRWFAEELPELPVVAAGSLLDLRWRDHGLSMPVGRVTYCYVGPMTFPEYLRAHGQDGLVDHLCDWLPDRTLATAGRDRANEWFHRYAMVGGMPGIVAADVANAGPDATRRLQRDLVASYRDDFAKYVGRMDTRILDSVLAAIAGSLGRKVVYARLADGVRQQQAKSALELLARAHVCHLVRHTAANGLPLGAEVKDTFRKAVLLDVGLAHALLGTPAGAAFPRWADLAPQVRGQLTEQLVGQALAAGGEDPGADPDLYYWQREGGRACEIDFVVQIHQRIVPVEIKAGAAGAMKSLHQFMLEKHLDLAARIDSNEPSLQEIRVKTTRGEPVRYRLLSLPHFLAWRLPSLARADIISP